MMYPRLKLSRDLLQDDGVIFISIDDNEQANLKKVCDEIFGEDNLVGAITNTNNPKGRSEDTYLATAHEYLLIYAKSKDRLAWFGFEPTEVITRRYNKIDSFGLKYREIDLRKTGEGDLRENRPNMFYYFYYNSKTQELFPSKNKTELTDFIEIIPQLEDGREGRWRLALETALERKDKLLPKFMPTRKVWGIMEKDYLEGRSLIKPTSSWTFKDVNSERGSEEFIELGFDKRIFPKPKPLGTITRCLQLSTSSTDTVLDFFAGSATTAHAVMQLNAEDGGNRKCISVQYPEDLYLNLKKTTADAKNTIEQAIKFLESINKKPFLSEIGKERIRRAGEKIKADIEVSNAKLDNQEEAKKVPDIGFKVFRTANTNIKWNVLEVENQNAPLQGQQNFTNLYAQALDKIDFLPNTNDKDVVYEIMLRQNSLPLSSSIEVLEDIGSRTYLYASAYLICLETEITEILIDKLALLEPLPIKFIFRDSAFQDDINLKDETFRKLKNLIEKNSGLKKQTYTIEFI